MIISPVQASPTSWTTSTPSVFQKYKDSSTNDPMIFTQYAGKSSCEQERVKTTDIYNIAPGINDTYTDECLTPMSFGAVARSGKILINSHNRAISISYRNFALAPVAYTSTVYFLSTDGYSSGQAELRKITDFGKVIDNYLTFKKAYYYSLSPYDPLQLDYHAFLNSSIDMSIELYASSEPVGNYLTGNTQRGVNVYIPSLSFSHNGLWAFFQGDGQFYRLHTSTNQLDIVTPQAIDPWNGGSTTITSITNDGTTASFLFNNRQLILYDINNCIDQVSSCKKVMTDDVRNGLGSGAWIYRTEFIPNGSSNALKLWLVTDTNPNRTMEIYHVFPDQASLQYYNDTKGTIKYLALGDSFSSGEGSFSYRDGTDEGDNKCHQSPTAYSETISSLLSIPWHYSIACSGAVMNDVLYSVDELGVDEKPTEREEYYNDVLRKSKQKEDPDFNDSIYSSFLPGYRQQIRFIERHQPNTITLSISGNDLGFSPKLRTCLFSTSDCFQTPESQLTVYTEILSVFERLSFTLKTIKDKSPEDARIYVIGYPKLFVEGGSDNCGLNVLFSKTEQQFGNNLVTDINTMIATAARKAGVVYVDVENSLQEYALCSSGSRKAVNGMTRGNDTPKHLNGPIGNESYHPTVLGHQLMTQAILTNTNNLTLPMPEPQPTLTIRDIPLIEKIHEVESRTNLTLDTATLSAYLSTLTEQDILYQEVNYKQYLVVSPNSSLIEPNTFYDLIIHSTPTHLARAQSDSEGKLDIHTLLPDNIPLGFHTLHLVGMTSKGRTLDIYKSIYVAFTPTDYDGDGIQNPDEKCLYDEPSYIDTDHDTIDDACDPIYESHPTDPTDPTDPNSTIKDISITPSSTSQIEERGESHSTTTVSVPKTEHKSSFFTHPLVLSMSTPAPEPVITVVPESKNHRQLVFIATSVTLLSALIILLLSRQGR